MACATGPPMITETTKPSNTTRKMMPTTAHALRTPGALLAAFCLVVALASCSDSSKTPSTGPTTTGAAEPDVDDDPLPSRLSGAATERPDAFFGFNGASIVQTVNVDLLLDERLQNKLADFPARLIRVPTGTAAQWIDWRTGKFIDDPTSPFAPIPDDRRPVTMTDWAQLVQAAEATPVWDLNVLNATLDDQIAMLDEAKRLGMSVEYIELGNELWDVRSIYPDVYPSGTDYAKAMNAWIPELRDRFGDVQIAVSGADPSDEFFAKVFGERFQTWNDEVLATIEGADALAIHPYWTLPDRVDPGSDVAATLTAGLDAWTDFTETTLSAVPDGMGVWLTEWNQAAWASDSGTQIWAQALSVAAVAMRQAADPRIEMSLVHDIVDGEPNPHDAGISTTFPAFTDGAGGSEALARTALGHVLPVLFDAIAPGSTVQALDVIGGPTVGDHPGIVAVRITGANPGAVFVNLSDEPVKVQLDDDMTGTWDLTTLSAAADAQPGWVRGQEPDVSEATATGSVEVPRYSILRAIPR